MADPATERPITEPSSAVSELGGLRFDVSFRTLGATLRVDGRVGDGWSEILRFDDFADGPHFHSPADADPIPFDRAAHGEPLAWFIAEIRDHLAERLTHAGYGDLVPTLDLDAISQGADALNQAMIACVPAGFVRVPGVGLQRVATPA
jgi:hypothetical protein